MHKYFGTHTEIPSNIFSPVIKYTGGSIVLCRPGLKAASRPERAVASPAVSKLQLWLGWAYGSGFSLGGCQLGLKPRLWVAE